MNSATLCQVAERDRALDDEPRTGAKDMQRPKMLWADIGMAVAVGVFLAIIMLFHGEDTFTAAISTYIVALIAWVFFCEWAVTRADMMQSESIAQANSRTHNLPIPH